eukprot:CAMPEP_0204821844 /NCGR_PEP_ID=MMETSP1346-20131115/36_1 /ASSEMBLY_ACC=CAM_ASM_000771 /TAXON_ID=215587 /ORGANISM="Aplanochytrium stocchinoi, Strain GSBS06" /LENGTH=337 /DNA_ID=CAMNT_0051947769 /DNA_START=256 /DNA_END=1269 /DNA_ORIENTATION=-
MVLGLREYQSEVPNGGNVMFNGEPWPGVGHNSPGGGPAPNNQFGLDFAAQGKIWTTALCEMDSDGDGVSNGAELGDPNCVWSFGQEPEFEAIGHPGLNDNEAPPKLDRAIVSHGTLMIIAWVVFAPIGMFLPLINKTKKPPANGKKALWYKYHKIFMVTAAFLCLVAYIIMVNFKTEFSTANTHEKVGTAVVILTILQPLGGAFRIHVNKDGSRSTARKIWEYAHQWAGRIIIILAITAIYFGLGIAGELQPDKENVTNGVRIFIVILFAVGSVACFIYVLAIRKDERVGQGRLESEDDPLASNTFLQEKAGKPASETNTTGDADMDANNTEAIILA